MRATSGRATRCRQPLINYENNNTKHRTNRSGATARTSATAATATGTASNTSTVSNGNNNLPKEGNGIGGLLTTIAGKGGERVQVLVVLVVFINTAMTKCNGISIKDTDKRIDKLRLQVFSQVNTMSKQLKSVYANQNFLFDFVDENRAFQDRVQTKLDIPHPTTTPFPRQILPDFPDFVHPYNDPYQQFESDQ